MNISFCREIFIHNNYDTGEADLVFHHLKLLLDAGVSPSDVAIIAPYNLQVANDKL